MKGLQHAFWGEGLQQGLDWLLTNGVRPAIVPRHSSLQAAGGREGGQKPGVRESLPLSPSPAPLGEGGEGGRQGGEERVCAGRKVTSERNLRHTIPYCGTQGLEGAVS